MIRVISIPLSLEISEHSYNPCTAEGDIENTLNQIENEGGTILNITSDRGVLFVIYRESTGKKSLVE